MVIVCKTDPKSSPAHKGISLLVVEEGTPGFKRGKKLNKIGIHSGDTGEEYYRQTAKAIVGA